MNLNFSKDELLYLEKALCWARGCTVGKGSLTEDEEKNVLEWDNLLDKIGKKSKAELYVNYAESLMDGEYDPEEFQSVYATLSKLVPRTDLFWVLWRRMAKRKGYIKEDECE